MKMIALQGSPVSKGIAIGNMYLYEPFAVEVAEQFIKPEAIKAERERYAEVLAAAAKEIQTIRYSLLHDDPEKAKIFTAHMDILNDPAIEEEIGESIEADLCSGDWAIWNVYAKFIKMIAKAKDPEIRERSADFEDVRKRILRIWYGVPEKNLSLLASPVIIAAKDLLPSDTATLDRRNVLAIITESGGATSHSAIIARSYEIPAVLGIPHLLEIATHDCPVAVDAISGEVFLNPDGQTIERLVAKRQHYADSVAQTKQFLTRQAKTADGEKIDIGLNIANADSEELAGSACTDFVGLFRTEFLYMGRSSLPSEDEQFNVYRKVFECYGKRPVTLRTLDIGGDKTLDCLQLPKEDNPFLGKRALRLCFSLPDVFKTQLRAALRAAMYGNLHLMLPMVGSIDDIRNAKRIIKEVKTELDSEGIAYSGDFKLGIMIEIPSIALVSDIAAAEVDFASLGTNDLCQYLTAVDRMNPEVSQYYQNFHPAMFRLIGEVANSFGKAGKPLSVCGEMGGDPLAAAALVGLGLRKLSMGLASVANVKAMLSRLSVPRACEIAATVKRLSTAAEVEEFLSRQPELSAVA